MVQTTWLPKKYNDIVRLIYEQLYAMNIGCDMLDPSSDHLDEYMLLIVPTLYAAPDSLLERLNAFVSNGGHIVYSVTERKHAAVSWIALAALLPLGMVWHGWFLWVIILYFLRRHPPLYAAR